MERDWEGALRRLEDSGFAVEPEEPGRVYFETKGVERLYGGLEAALERALASVGTAWDPRAGAAQRRFAALAAASVARPGQALVVAAGQERGSWRRCRVAPAAPGRPLRRARRTRCAQLGSSRRPGGAVAEAARPGGRRRGLARGGESARVRGRRPPAELVEALEFPEAVGNELTLRRAFGSLLDRLLARPERAGRPSARSLFRPSRRRRLLAPHGDTARPTADRPRLRRSARSCSRSRLPSSSSVSKRSSSRSRSAGSSARETRWRRGECTPERRFAPGARQHRLRFSRRRRGGGAVVADSRSTSAVRSAGRINAPRPALVEASPVGVPVRVNREGVALVREEWRVVDRWWTEDPLDRRYFDVVLESGQNACVFRDEEAGCWFSQRLDRLVRGPTVSVRPARPPILERPPLPPGSKRAPSTAPAMRVGSGS